MNNCALIYFLSGLALIKMSFFFTKQLKLVKSLLVLLVTYLYFLLKRYSVLLCDLWYFLWKSLSFTWCGFCMIYVRFIICLSLCLLPPFSPLLLVEFNQSPPSPSYPRVPKTRASGCASAPTSDHSFTNRQRGPSFPKITWTGRGKRLALSGNRVSISDATVCKACEIWRTFMLLFH